MPNRDNWFDRVGALDRLTIEGDCQELEFTHGIETEYFLVDKKGMKQSHAEFGEVYRSLISKSLIDDLEKAIPKFYDKKASSLSIQPSKSSTYDALVLTYHVRGSSVKTELISVDRNVAEWPLIELATPPCESLYELGWWGSEVLRLVNGQFMKLKNKNHIMPFGIHPYERIEDITQSESFPTCGEHHHIKLIENANMNSDERTFFTHFYHLVRFFTSYLIMLSACSPFASGKMWGRFRPDDVELPFPRCVRSLRVLYNKKHLNNFQEGEYLPYLEKGWLDSKYFLEEFKKQSNSYRTDTHFFDVDPYSKDIHTTEIRFFDSQPSTARRVGLAALIQMIAKKAKNLMVRDEENMIGLLEETNTNLHTLKKMACEGGNWFTPSVDPIFGEFSEMVKLKHSRIPKNIFSDLVLEMLYMIRGEIKENNLIYSRFLVPIRQSIYGFNGNGISPAQYWLMMYVKQNKDIDKVIARILECTKNAENMWYDPIVNEPIIFDEVIGI